MDFGYPPEAEAYREKVQAFLAEHLPADWNGLGGLPVEQAEEFTRQWRRTLHEHGYLAVAWPKEYGGGGPSPPEAGGLARGCAQAGGAPSGAPRVFRRPKGGTTPPPWGTRRTR